MASQREILRKAPSNGVTSPVWEQLGGVLYWNPQMWEEMLC